MATMSVTMTILRLIWYYNKSYFEFLVVSNIKALIVFAFTDCHFLTGRQPLFENTFIHADPSPDGYRFAKPTHPETPKMYQKSFLNCVGILVSGSWCTLALWVLWCDHRK